MKLTGLGKGVNKDQPAWELGQGYWSDCQNMRFRAGRAQRVGGIASVLTPSITPYFLLPYSSGATRYVFYVGTTKAYVHDGSSETEITRTTAPAIRVIASASRASGVATITTTGNHGLTTGDIVTVSGFTGTGPTSDKRFNKLNATVTVTGATTFTYTVTATDTSTATSTGAYSIVYFSGGVASNFTGAIDDKWTGGNYNGVVYANSPVDGLFYYDQAVTGKLHSFPDTTITKADAARAFKNYIFVLAPTVAGTKYPHRAQWSQSADPGSVPISFTPDPTNDAGNQDLVSEGEMVDAREWGDVLFIYKRDCRFAARLIGGQFIFSFQLASGNHKDDGLLAANCVANTPQGQVFLTNGYDVRIHVGGESKSILFGRMLDYLQSNMDTTYAKRSFVSVNPEKSEVWICYPKTGQTFPSEAILWNWEDDTLGLRTLSSVTAGGSGMFPTSIAADARLLLANSTPKIGLTDSGSTDFGSTYTSMLERKGLSFDDPGFKVISKSMPYFSASTNFTATVYHGSHATQGSTVNYSTGVTYTHNTTDWVNAFSPSGKYGAIKVEMTCSDTPALVSWELDVKSQGKY